MNNLRGETPFIYTIDDPPFFDEAPMPKRTGIKEIDKEQRVALLNKMLKDAEITVEGKVEGRVDGVVPIKSLDSTESVQIEEGSNVFVMDQKTVSSNGAYAVTYTYPGGGKKLPKHHLGHRGYTKPKHTRKKRVKPARRK